MAWTIWGIDDHKAVIRRQYIVNKARYLERDKRDRVSIVSHLRKFKDVDSCWLRVYYPCCVMGLDHSEGRLRTILL